MAMQGDVLTIRCELDACRRGDSSYLGALVLAPRGVVVNEQHMLKPVARQAVRKGSCARVPWVIILNLPALVQQYLRRLYVLPARHVKAGVGGIHKHIVQTQLKGWC